MLPLATWLPSLSPLLADMPVWAGSRFSGGPAVPTGWLPSKLFSRLSAVGVSELSKSASRFRRFLPDLLIPAVITGSEAAEPSLPDSYSVCLTRLAAILCTNSTHFVTYFVNFHLKLHNFQPENDTHAPLVTYETIGTVLVW